MKSCRHPAELLRALEKASEAQQLDASVIGAAMQTCGVYYWPLTS